ncbi:MAG: FtsQ-type POTRA domain-containing protein [Clostridia bacterium]|nr:FtsQ-type POTRA domain-containing protein [Clostridia bacterium]
MRRQAVFTWILAIVFAIVLSACLVMLFSVKEVDVNFNVTEKSSEYTDSAKEDVDKYLNKNLMFLDLDEVKESLKKYTYFDVVSINKVFPNKVEIEIKERQEGYLIKSGEDAYILDIDGFCLKQVSADYFSEDLIKISGIQFETVKVGEFVSTNNSEVFAIALDMAKAVNLSNCIEQMTIYTKKDNEAVLFRIRTDVGILVRKIKDDGVKKIQEAFKEYDGMTDYQKSYAWLDVYKLDATGEVSVVWTSQSALAKDIESLEE